MKQYTHAWIAMMAVKRLDHAQFAKPEAKAVATHFVEWIDEYRDNVIKGAWYPDEVIKDMSTGHILKHLPGEGTEPVNWLKLPAGYHICETAKKSPMAGRQYKIDGGNLTDRCEALTHSVVDNMKMLVRENRGSSFPPSGTHVAAILFMLSHYIADAHMPLHCDGRQYAEKVGLHADIEEYWDKQVKKCYTIDKRYKRFNYDPQGYPLKVGSHPIIDWVEEQIISRPFDSSYGTGNSQTWDFLSAIAQCSYLTSYVMIPPDADPKTLDFKTMVGRLTPEYFDQLSRELLIDAIDSISRVWYRAWNRYLDWENRGTKETPEK